MQQFPNLFGKSGSDTAPDNADTDSDAPLSAIVTSAISLFRRRWLVFSLVALATFAGAVILVFQMTPKYDAVAKVRINPGRNPLANAREEVLDLNSEAIETEVSILNSVELAQEVVRRLRLQDDPEFTSGFSKNDVPMTESERTSAIVREVMRGLTVNREKLTYIISVDYQSKDPIKAANIANGFATAYLDTRVGARMGVAGRQVDWLNKRLATLGAEVRAADERAAQFRMKSGIVEGAAGTTITDQQVGPLSGQLAVAEADAAAARAKWTAAQTQIARGNLDSVAEVRSSQAITEMRKQRADIVRVLTDIESRDGENHPELIKVRNQLTQIDKQIHDEATRAAGALQASAIAQSASADALRRSMRSLEVRQAGTSQASVTAAGLEREAANKRAAYDKMAAMALESSQAAQNSIGQAEIVDRARPPQGPTSPNKPLLVALAMVFAIALGTGTIITQEMLAGGLRTVTDIERRFKIPVIATVPALSKKDRPADDLLRESTTLFAEALRNARASILGVRSASAKRVIAITSALPSEGKSTTALSFARILAMHGAKTLLIDCDVRKATLRSLVDAQPAKDLGQVLLGKAHPSEAIIQDKQDGLSLLMVNEPDFSGTDLFGGGTMEALLGQLRERFDLIVIDLPPVLGVADTRFLAAISDVVAFVVKWNSTPIDAVSTALNWLSADQANVVGAIYTMVDPKSEAVGSLYYAQRYTGYYRPS